MEELQDAIEDAQYMNAMHDDVPKPTKVCKKKSQLYTLISALDFSLIIFWLIHEWKNSMSSIWALLKSSTKAYSNTTF